jgi:hypothetical protein
MVNLAAIGWFTNGLVTGAMKKVSLPVIFVATFFIAQLTFSYIASIEVRNYFAATHCRCCSIIECLLSEHGGSQLIPETPIPIDVYKKIISLICYTLISFGFFWIALSTISLYLVPLHKPMY